MAGIFTRLSGFFSGYGEISEEFYEDLEETLVMGDVGYSSAQEIIEELRKRVEEQKISVPRIEESPYLWACWSCY